MTVMLHRDTIAYTFKAAARKEKKIKAEIKEIEKLGAKASLHQRQVLKDLKKILAPHT